MPIRDLDTKQKLAATTAAVEVIVSAGAGSGKTSLLVGRYLHEVLTNAVPPDEIAAITFTTKAAAQMKARIAARLPVLARNYPEHAGWCENLAGSIHTAPISTIHAFCNAILRAHPLEAGIDPLFGILDETTLARLRNEAWRQFLDIRLDDDPMRYGALIRALGVGGLRKLMLDLVSRRTHVLVHLDAHGIPSPDELDARTRSFILRTLGEYHVMLRDFHAVRPGNDLLAGAVEAFLFEWEEVIRALGNNDPECPAIARIRDAAGGYARSGSKDKWEAAGIPREEVRKGLRECIAFLDLVESWRTGERGAAARTIVWILEEFVRFERFFLDLKKSRAALDNDDSLIETWRLLRRSPSVCRKVSASFRHILVDEFQDTDTLQLDILRMITGNSSATLFTVGDPKQSIYRFRGADVTVFNRFAVRAGVDFHSLGVNYRSCPAVIAFVNHAFARILGTDDVPHPEFEAVYTEMTAFRKSPDSPSGVEVAVFGAADADGRRIREAAHIARRALEFRARGVSFGEMALLLRKGTQAQRYEEAFLRAGVPFVTIAGGDPFDGPEAQDVANLLGWLAAPEDQTLFAGMLLSPFFTVDGDFLYALRQLAGKHGSLPETFLRADLSAPEWEGTGAAAIRETLRELLVLRDRTSIRAVLERAFEATGYTLALLADPIRGETSLAVLDLLLRSADAFEDGGGSPAEFARLLRDGELKENAPSIETRADALTIITIHKSKGLEYEVVFLADASGQPRSDSPSWLIHDDLGLGITLRDTPGRMVKTLALSLAAETEKLKALAESRRLFYVACTRAKTHLIITGGRPAKPSGKASAQDNWMGWLFDAFDIPRDGEDIPEHPHGLGSWTLFPDGETPERSEPVERWRHLLDASPEDGIRGDAGFPRFSYPPLRISGKPATLSPTQAERYLDCPARYSYTQRYPLDDSGEASRLAMRYGDLAHRILERGDYRDPGSLIAGVDDFAPRDIPESERKNLRTSLRQFAGTPLFRELAAADELRREETFAFLEDGVLIRGKIDLAARTGVRWMIVDYKTNDIHPEAAAVTAEHYRFQTGLYALALHRAEQILPERTVIHFLRPGVSHELSCGKESLDETAGILSRMIASLDAGDFRPRPSPRCGMCPYRDICSEGRK